VDVPRIVPNLWFDTEAEQAAEFYVSVFPNSRVTGVTHYTEAGPGPAGSVVSVDFELDGQPFTGINGGPAFTFSEAVSLLVECADQAEVDRYWDALVDGGSESQCGWLKDRYGLSWQVAPTALAALLADEEPKRAAAAMQAMFGQRKIDLAAVEAAADAAT
jgi:predicted 3-demethylubiquinone-9 3-methyltransferase (glyoxalase superfamily)